MTRNGFIYIIRSAEYFKVGFSARIKERMISHRTYLRNFGELLAVGCFPATTDDDKLLRIKMGPPVRFCKWPTKDWFIRDQRREAIVAELPLMPIAAVILHQHPKSLVSEWSNRPLIIPDKQKSTVDNHAQ